MILTTQEEHLQLYRRLIVLIAQEGDKAATKLVHGDTLCDLKALELLVILGEILCKFIVPGTIVNNVTIVESDNCLTLTEVEALWDYIGNNYGLSLVILPVEQPTTVILTETSIPIATENNDILIPE